MSTTTNKYGIKSRSIVDALTWDNYDLKDKPDNLYSCTEIIDSPKNKILQQRHSSEIVTDVSDNFWLLDGNAVHYSVEMSNKKGGERLSEERLYLKISGKDVTAHTLNKNEKITDADWYNTDDIFVTVKFDNYEQLDATIEDYKRASVWEVVFGLKKSRMQQLNIGALAMRLIGFKVENLRSILLLKSWDKKDYLRDVQRSTQFNGIPKYPPIPYAEFDQRPMDIEAAKRFLIGRAELFMECRQLADDDIEPCCEEDRFHQADAFAVMKVGNQVATKVFKVEGGYTIAETKTKADKYMEELVSKNPKNKYYIDHRPGEDKRCTEHCTVRRFCHFGREIKTEE